jgi:hypothetical protein
MDPSDGHEPALAAMVVQSEDIPSTNFGVGDLRWDIHVNSLNDQVYLGWRSGFGVHGSYRRR